MAPMGDNDRLILSGMYELERGRTAEQAAANLQRRFGWLTPDEAMAAVASAGRAMTVGGMLQFADHAASVADIVGSSGADHGEVFVDVTVRFGEEGPNQMVRTLRLSVDPGATVGDVIGMIDDVTDSWDADYPGGPAMSGFSISGAW